MAAIVSAVWCGSEPITAPPTATPGRSWSTTNLALSRNRSGNSPPWMMPNSDWLVGPWFIVDRHVLMQRSSQAWVRVTAVRAYEELAFGGTQ